MILLNLIWPAIYICTELWRFWLLIFATIVIETFTIKTMPGYTYQKSILVSLMGNLISGIIGTFVMMWAMVIWHIVVDNFMPKGTFDKRNWIATFILMCLGSVFIETLAIKMIFKEAISDIFIPLLIGNLLSYAFIVYIIAIKERGKK